MDSLSGLKKEFIDSIEKRLYKEISVVLNHNSISLIDFFNDQNSIQKILFILDQKTVNTKHVFKTSVKNKS